MKLRTLVNSIAISAVASLILACGTDTVPATVTDAIDNNPTSNTNDTSNENTTSITATDEFTMDMLEGKSFYVVDSHNDLIWGIAVKVEFSEGLMYMYEDGVKIDDMTSSYEVVDGNLLTHFSWGDEYLSITGNDADSLGICGNNETVEEATQCAKADMYFVPTEAQAEAVASRLSPSSNQINPENLIGSSFYKLGYWNSFKIMGITFDENSLVRKNGELSSNYNELYEDTTYDVTYSSDIIQISGTDSDGEAENAESKVYKYDLANLSLNAAQIAGDLDEKDEIINTLPSDFRVNFQNGAMYCHLLWGECWFDETAMTQVVSAVNAQTNLNDMENSLNNTSLYSQLVNKHISLGEGSGEYYLYEDGRLKFDTDDGSGDIDIPGTWSVNSNNELTININNSVIFTIKADDDVLVVGTPFTVTQGVEENGPQTGMTGVLSKLESIIESVDNSDDEFIPATLTTDMLSNKVMTFTFNNDDIEYIFYADGTMTIMKNGVISFGGIWVVDNNTVVLVDIHYYQPIALLVFNYNMRIMGQVNEMGNVLDTVDITVSDLNQ